MMNTRYTCGPTFVGRFALTFFVMSTIRPHDTNGQSFTPTIRGSVFVDDNQNGIPSVDELVSGQFVRLFLDDGDQTFDPTGDGLVSTTLSDDQGQYLFDQLDARRGYFVQTDSQTGFVTSQLILPGELQLVIDSFETPQWTYVDHLNASASSQAEGIGIVGSERDIFVERTDGIGELMFSANRFGLEPVIDFSTSAGVAGRGIITWDGTDDSTGETPGMGLAGIDLTADGKNQGLLIRLGVDGPGAGETLTVRLFEGDAARFSEAAVPMPVTDGRASEFAVVPFDSFVGDVFANDVDAIQIILETNNPSVDAQIGEFGALGPKSFDFALPGPPLVVPEPSTLLLGAEGFILLGVCFRTRQRDGRLSI